MNIRKLKSDSVIGDFMLNGSFSLMKCGKTDICTISRRFFLQFITTCFLLFCYTFLIMSVLAFLVFLMDAFTFGWFASFVIDVIEADSRYFTIIFVLGSFMSVILVLFAGFVCIGKLVKRITNRKSKKRDPGIINSWWKSKREKICFEVEVE